VLINKWRYVIIRGVTILIFFPLVNMLVEFIAKCAQSIHAPKILRSQYIALVRSENKQIGGGLKVSYLLAGKKIHFTNIVGVPSLTLLTER